MHRILFLLLAAAVLPAQTVYLRTPGTGYCKVTAATNATPIRLTVNNVALCGINTDGQVIIVAEVLGNRAANIHLENALDTANLARKVSNLTGNSFDLLDLANNPVSGSGAFVAGGGRVGLATAYTLAPHPRMLLDGPSGTLTTSLSSPTGHASPSNLAYTTLKTVVDNYVSSYGSAWGVDNAGVFTVSSALRWKADGDSGARTAALWGLDNVDQLTGTPACTETLRMCGTASSSVTDYETLFADAYALAYTLMRDEMTPSARSYFLDFMLNDYPWSQGGLGYTGTSLVKPAWKVRDTPPNYTSGTVTLSGTTVTGVGTSFTATAVVGDSIMIPHPDESVYAINYLITAVNSDTSLTVAKGGTNSGHYAIGPRWTPSMYGWLWNSKHFDFGILCGGSVAGASCESTYGFNAGLYQTGDGNHAITGALAYIAMGLVTCGDDPRGCLLLSLANEFWVDEILPVTMTTFTGFSQSAPGYHAGRTYTMNVQMNTMLKLSAGPDYLAATDIVRKGALWQIGGYLQSIGAFTPFGEAAGPYPVTSDHVRPGLLVMHGEPASNEARYMKDWLFTKWGDYSSNFLRYGGGAYVWFNFLYTNPAVTPLTPPTTFHFTQTSRAQCIAQYGAANCPDGKGRFFSTSNQNWNPDRTYIALSGESYWCADHCSPDPLGGWMMMTKAGKVLIGGDSINYLGGSRLHRPYVRIGTGETNFQIYPGIGTVVPVRAAGTDDYMLAGYDIALTYKAAAGVTAAEKQIIHLKTGSQDYVVDHVRIATSSATSILGVQQFHLNDCGTPVSSTCIAMDRSSMTVINNQPGAKLNSKVLGLNGSNVRIDTEHGSETDGSYAGGSGKSFSWFVCPTADGSSCTNSAVTEWAVVHKPSTGSGDTMPPIAQSVSGAFRIIEIQDPVSPKVAAFTTIRSNTATSVSFNTTHTGTAQYVVSGLVPGLYTILHNSVSIGVKSAAAGGNSVTFDAEAGSISVVPGPAALAIATPSIPDAVLGKPYNVTIVAENSTEPYAWQLTSGTLCAGLSFTQSGGQAVIAGAAETIETCSFTLRVTNSTATETDTREFTVTVVEPGPPLEIATVWIPVGRVDDSYSRTLQASGGTLPLTWTLIAGSLCPGLQLNAVTGEIYGTPSALSECSFTVRATDLGGESSERSLWTAIVPNAQSGLRITSAQASASAAVIQLGQRGLAFDQACTLELRLGGPSGTLLSTIASPSGPSRRSLIATGLPAGQTIHATAICGAQSVNALFDTGFAPSQPRPLTFHFRPPSIAGAVTEVVFSYGNTPSLLNSLVASCSANVCTAVIDTAEPLLYWRGLYRDAGANPLAATAVTAMAPR